MLDHYTTGLHQSLSSKCDVFIKTLPLSSHGRDEYVQKRQSLKQIKDSLREELSRMGVIT
jgi:hypothetical protein